MKWVILSILLLIPFLPQHESHLTLLYQNVTIEIQIVQCFTWLNQNQTFAPLVGNITLWTLHESIARNHQWIGYNLWVGRTSYLNSQVPYFAMSGANFVIVETSYYDPGQLSVTDGFLNRKINTMLFSYSDFENATVNNIVNNLISEGENVIAVITSDLLPNLWEEFNQSIHSYIIQIFMLVFCGVDLIIAAVKLILLFIFRKDRPIIIPQYILINEVILHIIRCAYFAIDPLCFRYITSYIVTLYLAQVTAPFGVLSSLLIIIYWNNSTKFNDKYIRKFKIPIIVSISVIFVGGVIVFPILENLLDSFTTLAIITISYIVLALVLSIYIFRTAPKVLDKISQTDGKVKTNTLRSKRKKNIVRQTSLIYASGIVTVLWCIPPILLIFPTLHGNPYGFNYILFAWFILLELISLLQLLVFKATCKSKRDPTAVTNSVKSDNVT